MESILSLLFPENISCLICQDEAQMDGTDPLCPQCRMQLSYILPPICAACGRAFAQSRQLVVCHQCRQRHPVFIQARAPFLYEGAVAKMVRAVKFHGQTHWARFLGKEMALLLQAQEWPPLDAILPVPLARARKHRRGYNQAALLAKFVAQYSSVPVQAHWLVRTRTTAPQTTQSGKERLANVQNAFSADPQVAGRVLLLIDDVFTTGATVNACATALLEAGCERVYVLTAASAPAFQEKAAAQEAMPHSTKVP